MDVPSRCTNMDDILVCGSPSVQRYLRESDCWLDYWFTELLMTPDPTEREVLYTKIKRLEHTLLYPWDRYLQEVGG